MKRTLEDIRADIEGLSICDLPTVLELCDEVETLQDFRRQVAGYTADLQRHIRVAADEGRFVPMGICAIIGHLSQLVKATPQ